MKYFLSEGCIFILSKAANLDREAAALKLFQACRWVLGALTPPPRPLRIIQDSIYSIITYVLTSSAAAA